MLAQMTIMGGRLTDEPSIDCEIEMAYFVTYALQVNWLSTRDRHRSASPHDHKYR